MYQSKTIEFARFIETLRVSRNISREDFLKDIISLRQYQRFLKGDTELTNNKVFLLSEKLGLSYALLIKSFEEKTNKEYQVIINLLSLMNSHNYNEALNIISSLSDFIFISDYYSLFYKYIKTTVYYLSSKFSADKAIEAYKTIVNPDIITKQSCFTYYEISSLIQIARIESESNNFDTINKIKDIIQDETITLLGRYETEQLPAIYSKLAQLFGLVDDYKKVKEMCLRGIKVCKENGVLNSLSHLYFFLSLSLFDLEDYEESKRVAYLCVMSSIIEGNINKTKNFISNLEEVLCIDMKDIKKMISIC